MHRLTAADAPGFRSRFRRVALIGAMLALFWACVITVTGGVLVHIGGLRLSSRNPTRLLVLMGAALVIAWLADRRSGWGDRWAADFAWLPDISGRVLPATIRRWLTPAVLSLLVAVATVYAGTFHGAHVAGGSDSYGYVSQARLWTTGVLKVQQPLIDDLPAGVRPDVLAPLGYRVSPDRRTLVPVYSPGLPMTMSLLERVGGPRAVYLVMPILAGLLVWLTYAIGARLTSAAGAFTAALFLAISPVFVFQLVNPPMSDIATASWWALALYLAMSGSDVRVMGAGLATGTAILTRPNLAPLAMVPAALVVAGCWRIDSRMRALRRFLLFAAPVAVACGVVGYLNSYWYGSPLESGYGNGALAGGLFQWRYFWPNLSNYAKWTYSSEGALSLLALLGLAVLLPQLRLGRSIERLAALAFAALAYACYAFYMPFDSWVYLRFLIPALPIFCLLVAIGGFSLISRLDVSLRPLAVMTFVLAACVQVTAIGRSLGVYDSSAELRYEMAGRHVAANLPQRAAIFSMLHSGSVRYYSDRLTVRYDLVPPEQLQRLLGHLELRGFVPFALVDDEEDAQFRQHLSTSAVVASAPVRLRNVTLYSLSAR